MFTVFLAFLRLGLTSFGGPVAHIGYFRRAFVTERRWLDEPTYAEIVALCSFLPGPTSSQVGISIGALRAGAGGAFAAWAGFTLPSAVLMAFFASHLPADSARLWLHGLLLAAVAVVADAIVSMARTLTPDPARIVFACAATAMLLAFPGNLVQIAVLAAGAAGGAIFLRRPADERPVVQFAISRNQGAAILACFAAGCIALAVVSVYVPAAAFVAAFVRAGSLVFGGGHVVLPLLQSAFVPHAIGEPRFLAGYGLAQAMPGPLFTFASYLGASVSTGPGNALGAVIATCAIFAPSFFLIFGLAPFWADVRRNPAAAAAVLGLGATVVGLLAAAFVNPIWNGAIRSWEDIAVAAAVFALLRSGRVPPWGAVAIAAILGALLVGLGLDSP